MEELFKDILEYQTVQVFKNLTKKAFIEKLKILYKEAHDFES